MEAAEKHVYEVVEVSTNEAKGIFNDYRKASMYLDACEKKFYENTGIPGYGKFKIEEIVIRNLQ